MKLFDDDLSHNAFLLENSLITYADVNRDVKCLARYFYNNHYSKIMIVAEKSYMAYCVIWASYYSGATFCCINSDIPETRVNEYIASFIPDIIISDRKYLYPNNILINTVFNEMTRSIRQNDMPICAHPNKIIYVLFTSGSTGNPKGVAILRKAFEEVIEWSITNLTIKKNDIVGQFCNIGFDMGLCDVFLAWSVGATLVPLIGISKSFPGKMIKKYSITSVYAVPTFVDIIQKNRDYEKNNLKSVRILGFGGGSLLPKHLEYINKYAPNTNIYNTYGPTETTLFTSCVMFKSYMYQYYTKDSVCLGYPLPNVKYSIVENSTKGELLISGNHCMAGYLSEQNTIDYSNAQSINKYLTGDIVQIYNNNYFFISRKDNQTKLHGNRIELDGIDAKISLIGIQSVSLVIDDELIIFACCQKTYDEKIKKVLTNYLPNNCMPNKIIHLSTIPLNTNGKVDRMALKNKYCSIKKEKKGV